MINISLVGLIEMDFASAKGYIFEKIVWDLLSENGYIKIESGYLSGRGAKHQIDTYGLLSYPTAFVYPIRLLAESKCSKDKIELPVARNFLGVIKDISENYVIGKKGGRNTPYRYTDMGCIFSASPFVLSAQNYAWAHNISLISFSNIEEMDRVIQEIDKFLNAYRKKIPPIKRLLSDFKEQKTRFKQISPELRVGIINNSYPVILVGKTGWGTRLPISNEDDLIDGIKIQRKDSKLSIRFDLEIGGNSVYFNIPISIGKKLIKRIDKTRPGEKAFELDMPIIIKPNKQSVRRILRIPITIPEVFKSKQKPRNKSV